MKLAFELAAVVMLAFLSSSALSVCLYMLGRRLLWSQRLSQRNCRLSGLRPHSVAATLHPGLSRSGRPPYT